MALHRNEGEWGVQLTTNPIGEMFIQADISKSNRKPLIKFYFSGTTIRRPLKSGDAVVWMEHFKAIFDAAHREADSL